MLADTFPVSSIASPLPVSADTVSITILVLLDDGKEVLAIARAQRTDVIFFDATLPAHGLAVPPGRVARVRQSGAVKLDSVRLVRKQSRSIALVLAKPCPPCVCRV